MKINEVFQEEINRVYMDVGFFQGSSAEKIFDLLNEEGGETVIDYLNENSNNEIKLQMGEPWGSSDETYKSGKYVLSYNKQLGYIGLVCEITGNELKQLKEQMSEEELNNLNESTRRVFKLVKGRPALRYRCTSGPKNGMLTTEPGSCARRKDPRKVRLMKKTQRMKKNQIQRKVKRTKNTAVSKLIHKLNLAKQPQK